MPTETLPRWILRRGRMLYFRRRVPSHLRELVGAVDVTIALGTDDLGRAVIARDRLNDATEAHWRALAKGNAPNARERYAAALERAKLEGFAYQPVGQLRDAPIDDILERLRALEAIASAAPDGQKSENYAQARVALYGGEPEPGIRLSNLFKNYEDLTRDERRTKSEGQLHKWRLPHQRAVANLIKVVGDKPIAEFGRADANTFRAWWSDRIAEEDLSPDSANKDMTHVGKMIALVSDRLELDLTRKFRGLRFENAGEKRPPFSTKHIRDVVLAPGALAGLNDDARAIILVMIETGARPIEIAHLQPDNIALESAIPHISIEPRNGYTLKTRYSRRQIPLIGVALEGARVLATATNRYADNTGSLSAAANKFMAEQTPSLLETDEHSLYSFRHAFKDRLTEVSAPDIVDAALMGHKFDRPDYGKGPSLELKLDWLRKIAVSN